VTTKSRTINAIPSSPSARGQQLQMELQALRQTFEDYKYEVSSQDSPTLQSSTRKQASSPRAQAPMESSCQGVTAGQAKARGKGGSRGRTQCSNCNKFGHRDKDCTCPKRHSPPPVEEEEVEIKSIRDTSARGLATARFGERDVPCTLDTCA